MKSLETIILRITTHLRYVVYGRNALITTIQKRFLLPEKVLIPEYQLVIRWKRAYDNSQKI